MKVTSTNIANPTTIIWNGQKTKTGIYKVPTSTPIFLGKDNVESDEVSDRNVHGGEFKACYLFSENQYPYWQNLYPNLNWNYGMFGENLTIKGLDETKLFIGDIYKIGEALVQITQTREPCFKLGVKFGSQQVLKQFITHGYPGTYVRVLEADFVKKGDVFKLIEHSKNSISSYDFFNLLFSKNKNIEHINAVKNNRALPKSKREKLLSFLEKR